MGAPLNVPSVTVTGVVDALVVYVTAAEKVSLKGIVSAHVAPPPERSTRQEFIRGPSTTNLGSAFESTDGVVAAIGAPVLPNDWYAGIDKGVAAPFVTVIVAPVTLIDPLHVVPTAAGSVRKNRTSVSLPRASVT
jgi:hypothetical protein